MQHPTRPLTLASLARSLATAIALSAVLLPAASRADKSKHPHPGLHDTRGSIERSRVVMGTMCTISADGSDSSWTARTVAEGFAEIERLDTLLNSWNENSELSRLNHAGAELRTPCSPELYAVIDSAMSVAHETEGAFDPTTEPLLLAWGVRGPGRVPNPADLYEARSRVGWNMVQIEPSLRTVRFRRDGMGIDLGSMAHGYALDQVAELFRVRRLHRAMVRFGEELVGFSDAESFVIELTDPAARMRPVLHLVLHRGALSTAAAQPRASGADPRGVSPIFDPETGRPLESESSVTVVTRSATRASALAAALLTMGREHAEAFIAGRADVGAVWLESQNGQLRAWRWNLPSVSASPGVRIDWRP